MPVGRRIRTSRLPSGPCRIELAAFKANRGPRTGSLSPCSRCSPWFHQPSRSRLVGLAFPPSSHRILTRVAKFRARARKRGNQRSSVNFKGRRSACGSGHFQALARQLTSSASPRMFRGRVERATFPYTASAHVSAGSFSRQRSMKSNIIAIPSPLTLCAN